MGKPSKGGKGGRTAYVSKGIVGHPRRTRNTDKMRKALNQLDAWQKGKNVMLTRPSLENKNIMERVPAIDVWGSPRSNKRIIEKDED